VDRYAPLLMAEHLPKSWPAGVSFDSTEFMYTDAYTGERSQLFSVLTAIGYEPGRKGRVWALRAYPSDTEPAWRDLMASVPGRPEWVVYDGDRAIGSAVRASWGRSRGPKATVLYWSEPHLFKNALAALKKDGAGAYGGQLRTMLTTAFQSLAAWDAFVAAAGAGDLPATNAWIRVRDKDVRHQVVHRDRVGKHSTGGAEPSLNVVKDELAKRSWTFRNAPRMNLRLGLLQLRLNRADNAGDWLATLTKGLTEAGGQSTHRLNRNPRDKEGKTISSLRTHAVPTGPRPEKVKSPSANSVSDGWRLHRQ
jgi:hypothetical protein